MKTKLQWIEGGGATSAAGWLASGVAAGLKANRTDMAILCSDRPAACAALFTSNNVPAAPVQYDRPLAAKGRARAAVVNVGCANACTGKPGYADTVATGKAAAKALGLPVDEILVCSTGTIGRRLPMDRILKGVRLAAKALSPDGGAAAALRGERAVVLDRRGGDVVGGEERGARGGAVRAQDRHVVAIRLEAGGDAAGEPAGGGGRPAAFDPLELGFHGAEILADSPPRFQALFARPVRENYLFSASNFFMNSMSLSTPASGIAL